MHTKTVLRANDVLAIINVSKPTFYRWLREGRFPPGIKYGPNTTGWPCHVIDAWLSEKEAAAHQSAAR